ncbi:hypothetical protein YC2023_041571 [Brassica napus]
MAKYHLQVLDFSPNRTSSEKRMVCFDFGSDSIKNTQQVQDFVYNTFVYLKRRYICLQKPSHATDGWVLHSVSSDSRLTVVQIGTTGDERDGSGFLSLLHALHLTNSLNHDNQQRRWLQLHFMFSITWI